MKGTLASPAVAFASRVLPVPGGPVRMAPIIHLRYKTQTRMQVNFGIESEPGFQNLVNQIPSVLNRLRPRGCEHRHIKQTKLIMKTSSHICCRTL